MGCALLVTTSVSILAGLPPSFSSSSSSSSSSSFGVLVQTTVPMGGSSTFSPCVLCVCLCLWSFFYQLK